MHYFKKVAHYLTFRSSACGPGRAGLQKLCRNCNRILRWNNRPKSDHTSRAAGVLSKRWFYAC